MITLLAGFFIKDAKEYHSIKVRESYGVLCGIAGIILNLLLFAGKLLAGMFSKSIAITADAFNNLSDAGSSLIMLIGFKISSQKPDPNHPFGHGRIEYLSGLLVALAILMMAVELIRTSVDKIFHPSEIMYSPLILVILIISIVVKCYMYYYNHSIGKKIDSAAMMATATDSISDSIATFAVLLATLISRFGGIQIDGYCGVLVGLFVFWAGISAARETINPLLGQPADADFVNQIEEIVLSYDEIEGIHDLVVHNYGPGRTMISLHAEVSANGNLLELHDVIDTAEQRLARELHCEAVIHMDPICTNDKQTREMKEIAENCLKEIDERLTLHDFRMVSGPTHTNLIFDVVVPFDFPMKDEQLLEVLTKNVQSERPESFLVVHVDHSYVKM